MDALTKRLGTRFLVVTVLPNLLLTAYVGFLLAAGAPTHSPSLTHALKALDALTGRQIIILLVAVLIMSVAINPLQTPLIQLVEGYWQRLPFGRAMEKRCTERFRRELQWVEQQIAEARNRQQRGEWDSGAERSFKEVLYRKNWLPSSEEDLLPTALGNILTTGEIRAGDRYMLNLDVAMTRLIPLLSDPTLADLRDRRNQLDAAVRLCVASGLGTAVGLGLLLWHGDWLFLPVGTYLVCWLCYESAVAAARGFSNGLAAVIDLNHLRLFDAMQLERPSSLAEEWELNAKLQMLFSDQVDEEIAAELRYVAPKSDEPSAG